MTITAPIKQGETGASSVLSTLLLILPPNSYSYLLLDHLNLGLEGEGVVLVTWENFISFLINKYFHSIISEKETNQRKMKIKTTQKINISLSLAFWLKLDKV